MELSKNDKIIIRTMGRLDKLKPTWMGVSVTVVGMLITFAISTGSDKNQITNNKASIEINRIDINNHITLDGERHSEIMRALGRIEGKLADD